MSELIVYSIYKKHPVIRLEQKEKTVKSAVKGCMFTPLGTAFNNWPELSRKLWLILQVPFALPSGQNIHTDPLS